MKKLLKLKAILKRMGSCIIAYSGGADSTFLLKVASDSLGYKALAVTAVSATYPPKELSFAKRTAKSFGVRHKVIKTNEFNDPGFVANPPDRCYYCKKELFKELKQIAMEEKMRFVADASNLSDKKDYRPGSRAKNELGIRSPLQEAGFTKQDIRRESRSLGLLTWDKPAQACLASRVPYGMRLLPQVLGRIDSAESYLSGLGFKQSRLRHHGRICRVEVLKEDLPLLMRKRHLIVRKLKKLGYNYITADLEGYRTGSMNEVKLPKAI